MNLPSAANWWDSVNAEFAFNCEQAAVASSVVSCGRNIVNHNADGISLYEGTFTGCAMQNYCKEQEEEMLLSGYGGGVCDRSVNIVRGIQQVPGTATVYPLHYGLCDEVTSDIGNMYGGDLSAPFEPSYAPCEGPRPWNYAYCYGAYPDEPPCPYVNVVDMEDFMNNEKRKEKSRDAARCRRSRETEIFTELAQSLPLSKDDVDQLDKASVMRLSIAYLRVRNMLELFPKLQKQVAGNGACDVAEKKDDVNMLDLPVDVEMQDFFLQTLDGFLLVLSNEGDCTYVSENVHECLGISHIDMVGQPIWEYTHQCDHDELHDILTGRRSTLAGQKDGSVPMVHRDFFIRLKCTLTSRGRSVNIKSASYKVIHVSGHIVHGNDGQCQLIAVGRPLPHPSNIEVPMGSSTFLTKHSMDMKFSYVDEKMLSLLGYDTEDLLGKSLFDYHHGGDFESLMATFKCLISKGQSETNRYRFLAHNGGYVWIVSQAAVVYEKQKPQSVVCVNYVISGIENENEIYSCAQLEAFEHSKQEQKLSATAAAAAAHPEQGTGTGTANGLSVQPTVCIPQSTLDNTKADADTDADTDTDADGDRAKTVPTPESAPDANRPHKSCTPPPLLSTVQFGKIDGETIAPLHRCVPNAAPLLPEAGTGARLPSRGCLRQPPAKIVQPQEASGVTPQQRVFDQRKNINSQQQPAKSNQHNHNPHLVRPIEVVETLSLESIIATRKAIYQPPQFGTGTCRPRSVTAAIFASSPDVPSQPQATSQSQTLTTAGIAAAAAASFSPITAVTATAAAAAAADVPRTGCATQSVTAKLFTSISALPSSLPLPLPAPRAPQNATAKIFAPRTEDMNKGYLMFCDDQPGMTMLKEEPDDLTHLAPTAGDACIALEESAPFFSDMFDDILLPDSYCSLSLMPDEINAIEVAAVSAAATNTTTTTTATALAAAAAINAATTLNGNKNGVSTGACIDPFINYKDESSDALCAPHLLSPGLSKSPESSLPSLCSPNGSLGEDELAFMTINMEDEIDMSMRAPYIPMSEADDLPLLISEDLMWGAFPEGLSLHKDIKDIKEAIINENQKQTQKFVDSSLAALLLCSSSSSNSNSSSTNNNNNNNSNNSVNVQQNHNQTGNQQLQHLQALLPQLQQHQHQHQHSPQQQHQQILIENQPQIHSVHIRDQHQQNRLANSKSLPNQLAIDHFKMKAMLNDQWHNGDKLLSNANLNNNVLGQAFNKNSNGLMSWTLSDMLVINSENTTPSPPPPLPPPLLSSPASSSSLSPPLSPVHVTSQPLFAAKSKQNGLPNYRCDANIQSPNGSPPPSVPSSLMRKTNVEPLNVNNKRASNASFMATDPHNAKRFKSSMAAGAHGATGGEAQSSPQLLQQLMAPSPTRPMARTKNNTSSLDGHDRWPLDQSNQNQNQVAPCGGAGNRLATNNSGGGGGRQSQTVPSRLSPQPSNSVLMNLLVSGCDSPLTIEPPDEEEFGMATVRGDRCLSDDNDDDDDDDEERALMAATEMDHRMDAISSYANPMFGAAGVLSPSPCRLDRMAESPICFLTAAAAAATADMEIWRSIQSDFHGKRLTDVDKAPGAVDTMTTALLAPPITGNCATIAAPQSPLLLELNEQDFELNAQISDLMLHGVELMNALEEQGAT